MPSSRVILKRLPVCPGRDSRFTLHRNDGEWWVHYQPPQADPIPADAAHLELVGLVNALKEHEGQGPGGSFSINEHSQVIARTSAPAGSPQKAFHIVDVSTGSVRTYKAKITFQAGSLDPTAMPAEGAAWPGPLCGTTYSFAAQDSRKPPSHNIDEVWIEVDGKDVQLSAHAGAAAYPPESGPVAAFLAALRRQLPQGGAFRVNEHGRAFTANQNLFIGSVPLHSWFPPISPTD
jgi:hypothetical protein